MTKGRRVEAVPERGPRVPVLGGGARARPGPPRAALWRLLATHEELTALATTIMLGTPSGACFDPDRLERDIQRPLAGVADTIAQQAHTLQLDPAAIQTAYERLIQVNAEWLVFRAEIDAAGLGPERMAAAQQLVAAWKSDITARFGDVLRSLRELVLLTAARP